MSDQDSSVKKKVSLDKTELDLDRAMEKVELDLEDAPFLDEEEEVVPQEKKPVKKTEKAPLPQEGPVIAGPSIWKNRKVQAGIVVLTALILTAASFLLLFRDRPQTPPEPSRVEAPAEKTAADTQQVVSFEPFMVELGDSDRIQFIFTRFSLPADSEQLAGEIRDKTIVLRDAIYYYLRNQEPIILRDKENSDRVKNDLLSVVNQYLGAGRVEDILFEEYLVR